MSAVAERAGVERRTLYRHFPNEAELFEACSAHYFSANPWPDLESWRAIRDPRQRLERALGELYAHYEATEPMYSNVLRDAELVDSAREAIAPLHAYLDEAADILIAGRGARGHRRQLLAGALRHALAFSTWRSLVGQRHRAGGCREADRRARRRRGEPPLDRGARRPARPRRGGRAVPASRAGLRPAHATVGPLATQGGATPRASPGRHRVRRGMRDRAEPPASRSEDRSRRPRHRHRSQRRHARGGTQACRGPRLGERHAHRGAGRGRGARSGRGCRTLLVHPRCAAVAGRGRRTSSAISGRGHAWHASDRSSREAGVRW